MGTVYDDLPTHEGYTIDHHDGHLGACSCGWHHDQPVADSDAAVDRWDQHHAGPLLERAVPIRVSELADEVRRAVTHLARTRPLAAVSLLDSIDRWSGQLRSVADGSHASEIGTPTLKQRLDAFAARARREPPGIGR